VVSTLLYGWAASFYQSGRNSGSTALVGNPSTATTPRDKNARPPGRLRAGLRVQGVRAVRSLKTDSRGALFRYESLPLATHPYNARGIGPARSHRTGARREKPGPLGPGLRAFCNRELPRISLPRTTVNKADLQISRSPKAFVIVSCARAHYRTRCEAIRSRAREYAHRRSTRGGARHAPR
jgi:hypothetical protein